MKKIDLIRWVDEASTCHLFFDRNDTGYRRIYKFWDGDKVGVLCFLSEGLEFTDELRSEMDKEAHAQHHRPYIGKYIWGAKKRLPVGAVKIWDGNYRGLWTAAE